MATDGLSLLFKLRASNEASPAIKTAQADIAKLTSTTSAQFGQMQAVTTRSLGLVTQNLTQFASRVPVVGTAVSGLTTTFGMMTTATGSASVGLGVFAGAAVLGAAATGALIGGIFKLAKETADYAANLHDVSQQLGIGTVLLSTLSVAADTSGASFTGATTALGKYLKNVSDANAGNEELRKKFIQVGFTQKDLTEAHKDSDTAITILIDRIGSLSNDQDRLNALQKVGVRNGQDLNGIIKEMDGNYAEFQKRVAAMGLAITPEQAIAADKFDDSLKFLELTIKGLAFTFGREFVPVITSGMNEIQSSLQDNEGAWAFWARQVRTEIIGVRVAYAGLTAFIASGGGIAGGIPAAIAAAAARNRELKSLAGQVIAGVSGVGPTRGIGPDGDGGAKAKANAALQAALKDAALAEKEAQQIIQANLDENKRSLDDQLRDIEEFTKRAVQLSDDRLNAVIDRTNREGEALQAALNKKLITQQEFDTKWREQGVEVEDARQKNINETFQLEQERDRKISAAEQASRERQLQIAEEADQRQIDRIRRRVDDELLLESEAQQQIAEIVAESFARRKKALEDELSAYATTLERRKAINDELIRLDGERAGSAEEAARRILKAQFDEQNAAAQGAERPRRVLEPIESPFADFDFDIEKFAKDIERSIVPLNEILIGSFKQLANAVGSVVAQWAIYGTTGPAVLRKVLAASLATIAAEAAVNAIKMTAVGFAHLAMWDFAGAASAFTSAGFWALLAGGSALTARAVAGDAFKQDVNDRNSRGSGTSSAASGSDRRDPIDLTRTQQREELHIFVHTEPGAGFYDHVVDTVIRDVHVVNGPLRDLIIKAASEG